MKINYCGSYYYNSKIVEENKLFVCFITEDEKPFEEFEHFEEYWFDFSTNTKIKELTQIELNPLYVDCSIPIEKEIYTTIKKHNKNISEIDIQQNKVKITYKY
jgi:hypothetical protein